jgi:hypothetical protein
VKENVDYTISNKGFINARLMIVLDPKKTKKKSKNAYDV